MQIQEVFSHWMPQRPTRGHLARVDEHCSMTPGVDRRRDLGPDEPATDHQDVAMLSLEVAAQCLGIVDRPHDKGAGDPVDPIGIAGPSTGCDDQPVVGEALTGVQHDLASHCVESHRPG